MNSLPLALFVLVISPALAGPLDPPVGPIAPTQKPLAEVEPRVAVNATNTPGDADSLFRITQPGSYYLTGNITGVSGKHGVEIAASGVKLDLNGFDLVGVPGSLDGVVVTLANSRNITVANGSTRNWGGGGIDLGASVVSTNNRVERVNSSGNGEFGISTGASAGVANCVASNNVFQGISVGTGSTIADCVASNNLSTGILTGIGSVVSTCTVSNNTSVGISAATGTVVQACAAINNSVGISASVGVIVTDCTASDNNGNGISAITGCTITACTSHNNDGNGISATNHNTITNCTVSFNGTAGISISSNGVVRDNSASFNGNATPSANIRVTGGNTRVENNNCTDAARGIEVITAGNLIFRNTCAGNTINYVIAADNRSGPIINITATGIAAISGNSAPDSSGTTHPWANFAY